jgi:hypothetical protein
MVLLVREDCLVSQEDRILAIYRYLEAPIGIIDLVRRKFPIL